MTGNHVKDNAIKDRFSIKVTNCNYVYTEKTSENGVYLI